MGSRERELGRGAAGVGDQSLISDRGAGISITAAGEKIIDSGQKHPLTSIFYGSPSFPTSLNPDRWVQREGYSGPNLGEKNSIVFDLYSIDVRM